MTTNYDLDSFRKSSRQVVRELGFFRSQYEGTGVTSPQAHILLELGENAPLSLKNLIENVRMDKSSASRTIQRLIDMRLVATKSHEGDQRLKQFVLTRHGSRKLAELDAVSSKIVKRALQRLRADERRTIFDGMQLYGRALKESRLFGEFEIRPVQPKDDRKVGELIKSILWNEYKESEEEVIEMLPELDSLSKYFAKRASRYFVALKDSKIIGGAGVAPLVGGEPNTCEIQKMYLEPSVRGKGLGSVLLRLCLEFARDAGYSGCYLDTRESMSAARKLYEQYGFKQVKAPLGKTGHVVCDCFYFLVLRKGQRSIAK